MRPAPIGGLGISGLLLRTSLLAATTLLALLLTAQLVRLRPAGIDLDPTLLGLALVALLEPALPLVGLFATGLTYGRLRRDGALIALAALGAGPIRRLAPALLLGSVLGTGAFICAIELGPRAVARLRTHLLSAWSQGYLPPGTLHLPSGRLDLVEDGLWATWSSRRGAVVLHGTRPTLQLDQRAAQGPELHLGPTWIWGPDLRVHVREARLILGPDALHRRLGTLGAPNSLRSAELDPRDPKQEFLHWRRLALPALAPIWAVLGALLGGGLGGRRALVAGAGVVALAAWLLRTGELTARAAFLPAAVAAFAPLVLVALLALWAAVRLRDG